MIPLLTPALWPTPLPSLTLDGTLVRLEPLRSAHETELLHAGRHEDIWRYMTSAAATTPDAMRRYVDGLLHEYASGTALPFVVRHHASDRVVGATRLKNLSRANHSALVGSWYSPTVWRTGVNVEAKLLLMTYAFESLGCIRIEFHTDAANVRSREALTRLGATEEGVLRACHITRDGRRRDSVIFSVVDWEWPWVRRHLEARLGRFAP